MLEFRFFFKIGFIDVWGHERLWFVHYFSAKKNENSFPQMTRKLSPIEITQRYSEGHYTLSLYIFMYLFHNVLIFGELEYVFAATCTSVCN